MIRNTTLFLSVLMLLIAPVLVSAQEPKYQRQYYDRTTNTPDHIAFPIFLLAVTTTGSDEDRQDSVHQIQDKLNLQSSVEAIEIFSMLEQVNADMAAEKQAYFREHLCPIDVPRPTGEEIYRRMNQLDDHNDVMANNFLINVKHEMDSRTFELLLAWLDEFKLGMRFGRTDHSEKNKEKDPDFIRQKICGRFDSEIANQVEGRR